MKQLSLVFAAMVLFGCKKEAGPAVMPPQEIPIINAITKDVPVFEELVGQIYGLQDIPIRARVDGFLEEIAFEEGTKVHKGQLLYRIDPDPYLAQVASQESKVAEAETRMVNADNELERYIPLAEINAVSDSDLDAAQATYDASKSSVKAAEANLKQARIRLSYTRILSPIDGLIGKTEAREGEYVGKNPNPVILNTVSRIDTVRVQFSISESKYLELAREYRGNKSAAEVRKDIHEGRLEPFVELILSDGSVYEEKGVVDFVNAQVNPTTGSLLIQSSFPNPSGLLRPGLYAKVRLQLSVAKDAIVVPQRCLMEMQGQYSVFTVGDDNKVRSKAVMPGYKMGDMVIITSGLQEGDRVVIDALQKVKPDMEIVPVPSDFNSKATE